jgi:hypothetical protein
MPDNPHFETLADWKAAAARLGWEPRVPRDTKGCELESLALFVRNHKMRELEPHEQSLEAHYGGFVFTQSRPGVEAADRAVRETSYGSGPRPENVSGHEARAYERGPEPAADDPDPRMPAVLAWSDGENFLFLASESLPVVSLLAIARSVR